MTTVSKCVPVASNARDSDALAAALGTSNVAYAGSGLLCAIDNYPANGVQDCGQSVGNGDYDFWSYWHGSSGQWTYANNGPAEQSVSNPADDVEGWRFQNGEPASSTDPPPGVAPSYAQICNASTEVPPAQTPSVPTTSTTTPSPTGRAGQRPGHGQRVRWLRCRHHDHTGGAPRGRSPAHRCPPARPLRRRQCRRPTTTAPVSGGSSGSGGGSHGSSDAHRIAAAERGGCTGALAAAPRATSCPVVLVAVVVAALGAFALSDGGGGRQRNDAGRRPQTPLPAPGGVVVVGGRPGHLCHADEQPVPPGADRSGGVRRRVRPPEQCAVGALHHILPARRSARHRHQDRD